MIRAGTFPLVAIILVCSTAAAAPLVTYESPCQCRERALGGAGVIKEKRRTTPASLISAISKGSRARVGVIEKIRIPLLCEVAQIVKESVAAGGRLVVECDRSQWVSGGINKGLRELGTVYDPRVEEG